MRKILFVLLMMMVFSSCKNGQTREEETKDDAKLKVFVVNYPLYYFAERIGGEFIELIYPIPKDVDPAYWVPDESLADIQSCDLILANGADYAKWMGKVSLPSSRVVNTSAVFKDKYIEIEEGSTHSHGAAGEHVHNGYAFTTWLDFKIALGQAEAIKNALVKKSPLHQDVFSANFEELTSELVKLDEEMMLNGKKLETQTLYVSHPVYQYLAQAYNLEIISEHWEPNEMPSTEQWINFKKNLKEHPSSLMLWEADPSNEIKSSLHELGIKSVVFNPCGNTPSEIDFMSVMKSNIKSLKNAAAK
jgi:zinc transport system substrate-binding protein